MHSKHIAYLVSRRALDKIDKRIPEQLTLGRSEESFDPLHRFYTERTVSRVSKVARSHSTYPSVASEEPMWNEARENLHSDTDTWLGH